MLPWLLPGTQGSLSPRWWHLEGGHEGRDAAVPPLARPVPHWDPSITQMGAVTPRLVPAQHHPWVNETSPEGTCSHTNPFTAPGSAQPCPIPAAPCPHCHLGAQKWAQGSLGTRDSSACSVPAPGEGHQLCFHHSDHSSATASSVKTPEILCCHGFIFIYLFIYCYYYYYYYYSEPQCAAHRLRVIYFSNQIDFHSNEFSCPSPFL